MSRPISLSMHLACCSILYDDEYSIVLKLKIYEAVQGAEENKQQQGMIGSVTAMGQK